MVTETSPGELHLVTTVRGDIVVTRSSRIVAGGTRPCRHARGDNRSTAASTFCHHGTPACPWMACSTCFRACASFAIVHLSCLICSSVPAPIPGRLTRVSVAGPGAGAGDEGLDAVLAPVLSVVHLHRGHQTDEIGGQFVCRLGLFLE